MKEKKNQLKWLIQMEILISIIIGVNQRGGRRILVISSYLQILEVGLMLGHENVKSE